MLSIRKYKRQIGLVLSIYGGLIVMPIPDIEIFIFPFLMSVFDITLQNAIFLTYDSGLVSLIVGLYLLDGKEWKKIKKKLKL